MALVVIVWPLPVSASPFPEWQSGSQPDHGKSTGCAGAEVLPTEQREAWFSEGPLDSMVHIIHASTLTTKPPSTEAAGCGTEGGPCWHAGIDPCMHSTISEHHQGLDMGQATDPRHILDTESGTGPKQTPGGGRKCERTKPLTADSDRGGVC